MPLYGGDWKSTIERSIVFVTVDTPLLRIQSTRDGGGPKVLYVYLRHKVLSSSDPWSSLNQQLKILKESWIIVSYQKYATFHVGTVFLKCFIYHPVRS